MKRPYSFYYNSWDSVAKRQDSDVVIELAGGGNNARVLDASRLHACQGSQHLLAGSSALLNLRNINRSAMKETATQTVDQLENLKSL